MLPALDEALRSLEGIRAHISAGGNLAFISLPDSGEFEKLNRRLQNLKFSGMTLRGEAPLWCGVQNPAKIAQGVKEALDPQNRFPGLDD